MIPDHVLRFFRRMLRLARTEIAAVSALFVIAAGVLTFVEVADDMTEADGQAFDQAVLTWVQPVPGDPRGPRWVAEDLTSLGGISVLTLFAGIAFAFLLIQRKRLSAALLALGLAGGVGLSE